MSVCLRTKWWWVRILLLSLVNFATCDFPNQLWISLSDCVWNIRTTSPCTVYYICYPALKNILSNEKTNQVSCNEFFQKYLKDTYPGSWISSMFECWSITEVVGGTGLVCVVGVAIIRWCFQGGLSIYNRNVTISVLLCWRWKLKRCLLWWVMIHLDNKFVLNYTIVSLITNVLC